MAGISPASIGAVRRFAAAISDDAMRVESFLQRGIPDSLQGAATRMADRIAGAPELASIRAVDGAVADALTSSAQDGMRRLVQQLAADGGIVTPALERAGMSQVEHARRAALETLALAHRIG